MDHYKPIYNVLSVATPRGRNSFGFKHSVETINKLKEKLSKDLHPKYGSVTSPETRKAISDGIKNFYGKNSHSYKGLKGKLAPHAPPSLQTLDECVTRSGRFYSREFSKSLRVEVTDKTTIRFVCSGVVGYI